MNPISDVLLLGLLGQTDTRQRIIDLLQRPLEMKYISGISSENMRLY